MTVSTAARKRPAKRRFTTTNRPLSSCVLRMVDPKPNPQLPINKFPQVGLLRKSCLVSGAVAVPRTQNPLGSNSACRDSPITLNTAPHRALLKPMQVKRPPPRFQTPDYGPFFTCSYTPPKRAPPRCAACASGSHRPTVRAVRARHRAGGVVRAHVPTRAMTAPTAHGTNAIAQRNSAKNRAATQPRNDASEFINRSSSSGPSACSSQGTDAATTSCRPRRRPRSQPVTRPATAHLPPRAPHRHSRGRRRGAAAAAAPP